MKKNYLIFRTCGRGLNLNGLNAHTLVFHTVTCARVDRDGRAVIGGAVLPTTSGPRIRSCEHLPFAGKRHALPQQRETVRRTPASSSSKIRWNNNDFISPSFSKIVTISFPSKISRWLFSRFVRGETRLCKKFWNCTNNIWTDGLLLVYYFNFLGDADDCRWIMIEENLDRKATFSCYHVRTRVKDILRYIRAV